MLREGVTGKVKEEVGEGDCDRVTGPCPLQVKYYVNIPRFRSEHGERIVHTSFG